MAARGNRHSVGRCLGSLSKCDNFYIYVCRWFHKSCTKLMKFTEKFSCKSVRMRCLEAPPPPPPIIVKPPPAPPISVKVKFAPDIQRFLIKDIKLETHQPPHKETSKEKKS